MRERSSRVKGEWLQGLLLPQIADLSEKSILRCRPAVIREPISPRNSTHSGMSNSDQTGEPY